MNVFLQSAANSALVKVARGSQTTDLFHYKTTATPTTAPERVTVAPIGNTAAFNSIVRFEIPNYGLLKSMFVRVKLSDDAGARVANSYASLQMCDYIEIASQNKVLCRITRDVMMAKMLEYGSDVCQNLLAGGLPNAGSGSNAYGDQDADQFSSDNKYVYIPWLGDISGLMSPPNQRWDTHFVERLEVRIKFGKSTALSAAAGLNMSAGCDLLCNFEVLSESDRKSLLTANYGRDSTLVLLNSSSFDEAPVAVAENAVSAVCDIHCKGVVKKTHLTTRTISNTDAVSVSQNLPFKTITINGSGRQLLTFDTQDLAALWGCAIYKSPAHVSDPAGGIRHILTIDWTVLKSAGYAGGISWREIASPQISVTYKDSLIPATGAIFQVTHEQHELLQIQPNNGRIMQSIST